MKLPQELNKISSIKCNEMPQHSEIQRGGGAEIEKLVRRRESKRIVVHEKREREREVIGNGIWYYGIEID